MLLPPSNLEITSKTMVKIKGSEFSKTLHAVVKIHAPAKELFGNMRVKYYQPLTQSFSIWESILRKQSEMQMKINA